VRVIVDRALVVRAVALVSASAACGSPAVSAPPSTAVAATATPAAATFAPEEGPLLRYRSRRLAVSLPLPEGRAWRIDDHSRPELVATHAPTRSQVTVAVFSTDEVVGRSRCEALARERKLVPEGAAPLGFVEDGATTTQGSFDTRIAVGVRPTSTGGLEGEVLAFGGFLRKCYAFVYSTQVERATDENALSARLAIARARVLGGLNIGGLDATLRNAASPAADPTLAPLR
jgi:hypothetical protein